MPELPPGAYVAPSAELADDVALGPGAVVYAGARIGAGTQIGAGAVVHERTVVGERCLVEDGAVLGKLARLKATSSARRSEAPTPLVLDPRTTVCCGAVVYAGARVGAGAIVGDRAQVRERAVIGSGSVVGGGSTVDFDVLIGERVSIQTMVYVTAGTLVEDDVFVGPGVTTTNDHTMGRHPRAAPLEGPTLRRACRVGGGAVLVPGVEIGEEAFVAAGAVVAADVPPRAVVMGVPARVVREVGDEDLIEGWR